VATVPKPAPSSEQLKAGLSLFDSVTLVAGSMIGSGIFIVSADITRQVATPAALLLVWLVAGVMTIAGALAYGELAAMMPQAGGQYVYLREAYGGMWAFMFGWTLLLVIQTGTIAAVAVAFARFAGVMWPVLGSNLWLGAGGAGLSGERVGAIFVIALLTAANLRGLNMGKWLQNSFTTAKLLSLGLIVVAGCILAPNPTAIHANFGSSTAFFGTPSLSFAGAGIFGAAMVVGRGIAHASSDRVAAAAMQVVWGSAGGKITAILVMISGFGCANGLILTGARVIYAMSQDRVFFAAAGRLNRASVPAVALVMQGIWAAVLTLTGTYSELLDYVIFAQLMFYVLTVSAVFVLRRRLPDAPRPYKAWGYPIVPALYVIAASALMIDLLILKPRFTWPGLLIALSGVPIYYWTTRARPAER